MPPLKLPQNFCLTTLFFILCCTCHLTGNTKLFAHQKPAFTDYCKRLEHDIQGRKHGFLAGNLTYYVGGFHASWNPIEDETIGLTHPFYHDLRARGSALLSSEITGTENTGIGNDYLGWEFYKDTRVLYGSVIANGKTYPTPQPQIMRWRPDQIICEYELDGIRIREQKFINSNDAIASIITSSEPIVLRFEGHSLYTRNSVSSKATARLDDSKTSILITEAGTMKSRPDPNGPERIGPSLYTGMTTAISISSDISTSLKFETDSDGVLHYTFSVPCDSTGAVVSWSMSDDAAEALRAGRNIITHHKKDLAEKTAFINQLLNDEIPWFRCPDQKIVDVYYYLWSLYLLYSIDVGSGWEMENHTQTAVNNFLGLHRYDATFQIKVGAWTTDKARYAYGNVLTWKHLTENDRFRELPNGTRMLSDNKGISWHSGAYGGETSEHVLGAWQIYEHTGDVEFLRASYEGHFDKLFRKRLTTFAMNEFEVIDTLIRIAHILGYDDDKEHWQSLIRRDPEHIQHMFDQRWEVNNVKNFFNAPKSGLLGTNSFWAMRSPFFPKIYAEKMVQHWAVDHEKGFFGAFFPLAMSKQSMKTFKTKVDQSFGYTPDTAYFMLDGMFCQGLPVAPELTLNHLTHYNWHPEWNIPVAPEAYQRDGSLFGDQYSNFNAGKILLYLEGLGGLTYSIPDNTLSVRPALPKEWKWMEIRLPIKDQWTTIRYEKDRTEVVGSPLPWEVMSASSK